MNREDSANLSRSLVGDQTLNSLPQTPVSWRLGIAASCVLLAVGAYALQRTVGPRGQALAGIVVFFGIVAVFSRNLRAVNWRTIGWGITLQLMLALLVLKGKFTIGGDVYSVQDAIKRLGQFLKALIGFSDRGAEFVFGNLARPDDLAKTFALADISGQDFLFPFAFKALPSILFASSLFTVLFHFGILQWCVRILGRAMASLMQTSGAETLSVSANVFMGQTESPLIVKFYVPRMTNSELFTSYLQFKSLLNANPEFMTDRSKTLTAFALTGFANFASVGVQLGGIGSIAPDRRHDLARLGMSALFVGFTATLLNAAVAGVLM